MALFKSLVTNTIYIIIIAFAIFCHQKYTKLMIDQATINNHLLLMCTGMISIQHLNKKILLVQFLSTKSAWQMGTQLTECIKLHYGSAE